MSTTVTYKGSTLATVNNNTKTLKTAGKYMEGDVILVDITDTPDFEELTVTPSDNTQVFTPYADAITYTVPSSTQLGSNPMTGTVDLSFLTYGKQYKVTGMFYTRSHYRSSNKSDLVEFDTLWTASEDGEIAFNLSVLGDEHAHPIKITLSKTQIKVYYPDSITISRGAIADTSASRDIAFAEKSCDAYSKVTVHAIPSQYIVPSGNLAITANGTGIDVTQYASVSVDVPTGSTINNQNKSVTPSESQQSITADSGYTGLGTVTVGAISSTYVGSGITRRSSTDLTRNAYTINVPAGYYAENASKTVERTTHATPTVSIDETTGLITARHTQTQGWVEGSGSGTDSTVKTLQLTTQAAKTVTPTESSQTAVAANVYTTGAVTVGAISSTYVGSGITQRDSDDLTVSGATVTAPAGYYSAAASKSIDNANLTFNSITNNEPSVASTNNKLTLIADVDVRTASDSVGGYVASGQQALGTVKVYLYSDKSYFYDNSGLTTSGATVTVPAGYYAYQVTKSVASGSATAPASISGTAASVSTGNGTLTLTKTVSVTPSVTAGYVSSGTAGNSSVSLTASVTIDPTPTASGATVTIPAGYYTEATSKAVTTMTLPTSATSSATSGYTKKATISRSTSTQYINIAPGYNSAGGYYEISAVANGSATGPSSLSGSSATVSTGTNTLTLTKTGVTTTPTVTAGYVSSATASTATVTLTASVTTKAAATITPTTTNQIIAAGTYLTGAQTIAGDADLVASNIISTANIFGVQGSVVVQNYYTGSSAPSSSLGQNGDIYLQE